MYEYMIDYGPTSGDLKIAQQHFNYLGKNGWKFCGRWDGIKCVYARRVSKTVEQPASTEQTNGKICGQCGKLLSEHLYNAEYKCYTCTGSKLHYS